MNAEMKHQQIYQEAAEWIIKIQQATLNETEQAEFEQWKMQSSMHQAAWSKAERLLNSFNTFPDDGQNITHLCVLKCAQKYHGLNQQHLHCDSNDALAIDTTKSDGGDKAE